METGTSTRPKLNLGAGNKATPGWVCIDRSPNLLLSRIPLLKTALRKAGILKAGHMGTWDREIVRQDMRKLTYAGSSVSAVYSSHALEHIYYDEAVTVLWEIFRVLEPGGIVRLALPDSTELARQLLEAESSPEAARHFNKELRAFPDSPHKGLRRIVAKASGDTHRWQPTPALVESMLADTGFVNIVRREFHQGELPDLAAIETKPDSFFLEARKPQ